MLYPVDGYISQDFGARPDFEWQLGYGHLGLDIAAPEGTPIYAFADGVALWADWCILMPWQFAHENMFIPGTEGSGITLVGQQDGYRAIFGHMSKIVIKKGQRYKRGDLLGYVGWTGNVVPRNTYGSHLHLETYTFPCSNYPAYSRYNPLDQLVEEQRLAGGAIVPTGGTTPTAPAPAPVPQRELLIPGVDGIYPDDTF